MNATMDVSTFSDKVLAMESKAYRIAHTILHVDQDCQDAWQQALMKAWQKHGSLRQPEYFETWLIRILINECRNIQRVYQKHDTAPLPENAVAPETESPGLYTALSQLSEKQRLPLLLHFSQGYTLVETAQMLSIPVSSVNWRLRQGKKQLRTLLGKEDTV